jgi:hypothetical protein
MTRRNDMTRRLERLDQLVVSRHCVLNLSDLAGQWLQAHKSRHALLHLNKRPNRINWLQFSKDEPRLQKVLQHHGHPSGVGDVVLRTGFTI